MSGFRAKMREGRRELHRQMGLPAFYFQWPNPALAADPDLVNDPSVVKPITVRVHDKRHALGDLKGTTFNFAEREDQTPRIIFMRDEVEVPVQNWIVSVEPGVAYRIGPSEAPNDITVTVTCKRLSKAEVAAAGFPSPPPIEGD